jgi:hypothetical protein
MIDLAYEKQPDAQQIAEMLVDAIHGAVDEHNEEVAAAAEAATLQSPILKLVKERNEARRLCALLAAAMPDLAFAVTSQKAMDAANNEIHQALMAYVKTRKEWDERSWK